MNTRELFVFGCLEHLNRVVVMGHLDCSELIAEGRWAAGLGDERTTHTARRYADEHPEDVTDPRPGDLGFFGDDWDHVIHVVTMIHGGKVLSADGATHSVMTYAEAVARPHARVRLHPDVTWYRSAPFLGWRRHHELDT
jgi:hypothetical protein